MEQTFRPVLTIRIFGEEKCFGPGVAVLLRKVRELHSLRAAAMSIGMAYSKAWTILKNALEFCTGSFMAVRTDVLQKIGGFDPAYFMYVEDADLTQKVLRKGTVWLAPQFHAIHAWHRAPMRDAGKFKMQLVSMGRYFQKWGCGKGSV